MNRETASARRTLKKQALVFAASLLATLFLLGVTAYAAPSVVIDFTPDPDAAQGMGVLEIMVLFGILMLLPSILLMMTSFTRIIIVLSFLRSAMGTQQSPPNQVLVGLALFLTLFIMAPVVTDIQNNAYVPYKAGELTEMQALEEAGKPLKRFMIKQTNAKSLNLFISISGSDFQIEEGPDRLEQLSRLPLSIIVPSFITSELERGFLIGFLIFVPFLIIDMVVSSVLMSMGMVMLPPAMISLPFKLLMFVLVDGWNLLLGTLVQGFIT